MNGLKLGLHQPAKMSLIFEQYLSRHNNRYRSITDRRTAADNGPYRLSQFVSVTQAENIRRDKLLLHGNILLAGALVRRQKYITQQFNPVEFINTKQGIDIRLLPHVNKGERAKVVTNERDIGGQTRNAKRETRLFTSSKGCR